MKRLATMCAGLLLAATACAPHANADGMNDIAADAARVPTSQYDFTRCVSYRESRGHATARGEHGSAAGRFQFIDRKWRHGLAHMVAMRLHRFGLNRSDALAVRGQLRAIPIWRWDATLQTVGFLAVLNADGPWSGWSHWFLPGSRCNRLVPVGVR
ncbi:MAG: hypothetical protein ACKOAF_04970 [Actinomycetes bacterium]